MRTTQLEVLKDIPELFHIIYGCQTQFECLWRGALKQKAWDNSATQKEQFLFSIAKKWPINSFEKILFLTDTAPGNYSSWTWGHGYPNDKIDAKQTKKSDNSYHKSHKVYTSLDE